MFESRLNLVHVLRNVSGVSGYLTFESISRLRRRLARRHVGGHRESQTARFRDSSFSIVFFWIVLKGNVKCYLWQMTSPPLYCTCCKGEKASNFPQPGLNVIACFKSTHLCQMSFVFPISSHSWVNNALHNRQKSSFRSKHGSVSGALAIIQIN